MVVVWAVPLEGGRGSPWPFSSLCLCAEKKGPKEVPELVFSFKVVLQGLLFNSGAIKLGMGSVTQGSLTRERLPGHPVSPLPG